MDKWINGCRSSADISQSSAGDPRDATVQMSICEASISSLTHLVHVYTEGVTSKVLKLDVLLDMDKNGSAQISRPVVDGSDATAAY